MSPREKTKQGQRIKWKGCNFKLSDDFSEDATKEWRGRLGEVWTGRETWAKAMVAMPRPSGEILQEAGVSGAKVPLF